jgi:hypothetical protein
VDECFRLLRPGGSLLIFETLGTGYETPHPPEHLKPYYTFLEGMGFDSTWIRTDYRFPNLKTARRLSTFFFGEKLGRLVFHNNWQVLPECTGIWSITRPDSRNSTRRQLRPLMLK